MKVLIVVLTLLNGCLVRLNLSKQSAAAEKTLKESGITIAIGLRQVSMIHYTENRMQQGIRGMTDTSNKLYWDEIDPFHLTPIAIKPEMMQSEGLTIRIRTYPKAVGHLDRREMTKFYSVLFDRHYVAYRLIHHLKRRVQGLTLDEVHDVLTIATGFCTTEESVVLDNFKF